MRYSEEQLRELKRSSSLEYAALHQSHLSFGLIEAVVEQRVPETILLHRTSAGDVVMTTRNIPAILRDWLTRARALKTSDADAHRRWYLRTRTALEKAHADLQFDVRSPHSSPFLKASVPPEDVSRILFLLAAVGEALATASNQFLIIPPRTLNWTFVLAETDTHEREMIASGWCPFTVAMLSQSVCRMGYASTIRPFIRASAGSEGHRKCTAEACTMNTIDTDKYQNRHVIDGCQCPCSKPPLDVVMQTLSAGQVPVLVIAESNPPSDTLQLTCTRSSDSPDSPYIAISHVWADGLGSTTDEGLPTCQLRHLAALAQRLVPGGALWMDSLCVPKDRYTRKRAIGLMGQTYRDASVVLVIDSGIRTCSVGRPLEEKLLRIVTSAWMQRLWTLQEAVLARQLVFQFADGLVEIEELLPSLDNMLDVITYNLAAEVNRLIKRRELPKYAEWSKPGFGLGDVARSLGWRTSSKLADETLAVSSLLNVDALQLADLPAEKRMSTMLMKLQNVPADIIFLAGRKLTDSGFRWAPETLMTRGGVQLDVSNFDAACTPEGLLATYPCTSFDTTAFRVGETWYIRGTPGNRCFRITSMSSTRNNGEYTCNTILLRTKQPQVIDSGIAVTADKNDQRGAREGEFRPTCVYAQRLLIVRTNHKALPRADSCKVLDARESGMLRVLLT